MMAKQIPGRLDLPSMPSRLLLSGLTALSLAVAALLASGDFSAFTRGAVLDSAARGRSIGEPAAIAGLHLGSANGQGGAETDTARASRPDEHVSSGRSGPSTDTAAALPGLEQGADARPPIAGDASPAQPDEGGFRLRIPYRSQFDGSTFEWGNCGVSAISMAMEYYGRAWPTHDVRLSINNLTGNWDTHIGVDWRFLKAALDQRDFAVQGPYAQRGGYLTWTLEQVLAEVEQGRPVMILLHYRSLPGHEEDEWIGDHYLLIIGWTADGAIVYHDPGFPDDQGAYLTIERERLERAWSNTWIGQNRTAMVILPPEG